MTMGASGLFLLSALLVQQAPTETLDFEFFRARVEPILLAKRDGHARCITCHQNRAQFHLQPLSPGAESWTEEQSRKNFDVARRLVVPGDPMASRLLQMALLEEAGGTEFHPGGKHFATQNDPEWQTLATWVSGGPSSETRPGPSLDFGTYRTKVEPIFLAKRDGHARCYVCHSRGTLMKLERLSEGSATYSEEQSRRNFAFVQRMVVPGDPAASRLLTMPLAKEAGGSPFHPGGKHWDSRDATEWRILLDWVEGRR